ncbi:MAG: hypothetical protein KA198_05475 [Chitinophagaceae bacterium]|nr:hypothetical protein [Chitinophagaceae bacterium]
MKKIMIYMLALAPFYFVACKKNYTTDNVTEKIVEPHYPTITLTGKQYYSINVNGALPTIGATAYDSSTKEVCPISLDASGLDNSTPGLYAVPISSINGDGYTISKNAFVAVTNITPDWDLSGEYARSANGYVVTVEKVDNGLYSTNNFFGGAGLDGAYAYFVQVDDSTMLMPDQPTDYGLLMTADHALSTAPADTFFAYSIQGGNITSNKAIRKFVKQ